MSRLNKNTYPGGKAGEGHLQQICNQMPPHDYYMELFLGSGAIFKGKRPALKWSMVNDISKQVLDDFFFCIDLHKKMEIFQIRRENTMDILQVLQWMGHIYPDPKRVFIYLDPPYPLSTLGKNKKLYEYTMSDLEHAEMLRLAMALPFNIMISSYENDLYNEMLPDWRKHKYTAQTRSGKAKTECLYMNYPVPEELHEYTFLGKDYRHRELIKKKITRFKAKLAKMPHLERYAIMEALNESYGPNKTEFKQIEVSRYCSPIAIETPEHLI